MRTQVVAVGIVHSRNMLLQQRKKHLNVFPPTIQQNEITRELLRRLIVPASSRWLSTFRKVDTLFAQLVFHGRV